MDELYAQARQLEPAIKSAIEQLSALAQAANEEESACSRQEASRAIEAADTQITQYQECLQAMDSMGAGGAGVTPTQQAARQRCREVAQDFQKSFRAARGQLELALDTQELLHGWSGGAEDSGAFESARLLGSERAKLQQANVQAEYMIEQAGDSLTGLRSQRQAFVRAGSGLASMAARMPGMQVLMGRIQNRRTRNNTVIALVIALCICFLLFYKLSGW